MKPVIGIDEVGRGPVAGPVAVGAFRILDADIERLVSEMVIPLRDSKQLSRIQREKWFAEIESWRDRNLCDFHVAMIPASEIDTEGISKSIKKALAETLEYVEAENGELILLDGSLHAPREFTNQITIIKGDELEPAISLASIVAKVTRDRYMMRIAERYPQYGFENHMGYGTKEHYDAIKKHGLTPLHRKTFLKSIVKKLKHHKGK